ncbi:hypothetical protein HX837_05595, partial [Marine Group I thaumarchaeote]|nr:hypothetical protein [Marine Group I thaumarchaeote]
MGDYFTRIGKTILNHDFIVRKGNISGSATSTGSFGAGYIDNKLGIGTTSPQAKLHVIGNGTLAAVFTGGSIGIGTTTPDPNHFVDMNPVFSGTTGHYTAVQRMAANITGSAFGSGNTYHLIVIPTSTTLGKNASLLTTAGFWEPAITLNGNTLTEASTLYVGSAPTEATNNYALHIDAGTTQLDGNVYLAIDSGNVGIGTTAPSKTLTVAGDISASGDLYLKDATAGGHASVNIFRGDTAGSAKVVFGTADDGYVDWMIGTPDSDDWGDGTDFFIGKGASSANAKFVIKNSNSYVGIGTTSPSKLLHVAGDAQIDGTLTAQEFHTEFVSASIIFSSGSTKFGDTSDDIHQFTGSLFISGSKFSFGDSTTVASGNWSAAFGFNAVASNTYAMAIGAYTDATGYGSVAIGYGSKGQGSRGVGIGYYAEGSGHYSVAIGYQAFATVEPSYAFGKWVSATGVNSIAIGVGTDNSNRVVNSSVNSFLVGFGTSKILFVTGSGNVGIGTTSPSVRLEVKASGNDDGFNIVDSSGTNIIKMFQQTTGEGRILMYGGGSRVLDLGSGADPSFFDVGNIGIGTTSPVSKLDVSGSISILSGSANQLLLPQNNSATNPTIAFGDGDTGFFESSDDTIEVSFAGSAKWKWDIDWFLGTSNYSTALLSSAGSSTLPVHTFKADYDTGMGRAGVNQLSLIAGGVEQLRIASNTISGSATSTGSFGRIQLPENAGSIHLDGGSKLQFGTTGYLATIGYNGNGNLDITARSGYNVDIVHGDLILTEGGINVKADDVRITGSMYSTGEIFVGGAYKAGMNYSGGNAKFRATAGGVEIVSPDGDVTIKTNTAGANVVFSGINHKISGSATSTGSFGAGYIDNKLGIGTTNPSAKLHVSDGKILVDDTTNNVQGKLDASDTHVIIGAQSNHDVKIQANNSTKMYISSSGNVGIGTSSPAAGLQVGFGTPGHTPASNGIYVVGQSEFDGRVYFDNVAVHYNTVGIHGYNPLYFNGWDVFSMQYKQDDGFHLSVGYADGKANRNIIIVDGLYRNKDFDHNTLSANPTLFIHSSTDPDADNTQWLGLTHESGSGQLSASIFTGKSDIKFSPSGSDVLFLSGSGNVGIGTTGPGEKLEVNGNIDIGSNRLITTNAQLANQGANTFRIYNAAGTGWGDLHTGNLQANAISSGVTDLPIKTAGTTARYISLQGHNGAGSYVTVAQVVAAATPTFDITAGKLTGTLTGNDQDITGLGNVGIGTTSPASTYGWSGPILHIEGSEPVLRLRDTTGTRGDWEIG